MLLRRSRRVEPQPFPTILPREYNDVVTVDLFGLRTNASCTCAQGASNSALGEGVGGAWSAYIDVEL